MGKMHFIDNLTKLKTGYYLYWWELQGDSRDPELASHFILSPEMGKYFEENSEKRKDIVIDMEEDQDGIIILVEDFMFNTTLGVETNEDWENIQKLSEKTKKLAKEHDLRINVDINPADYRGSDEDEFILFYYVFID